MNVSQTQLDSLSPAAGDGYMNRSSMPMDYILRIRFLESGHGAGDLGFIYLTVYRRQRIISRI